MTDLSHLHAIEARFNRETQRLGAAVHERNNATSGSRKFLQWQSEVTFREHQVAMVKKEIAGERKFLGLPEADPIDTMSIDDLARELGL